MGSFNISLTDTQTDALNPAFTHVYDVEVTSDTGAVTRIIEGTVTVSPGVTR
jgi:predicted ribosome-associated RNA-binding protein Tma20